MRQEHEQTNDHDRGRGSGHAPMRKNIIPHPIFIDETNVTELDDMDFVFVCVDRGDVKKPIIDRLEECCIPFIDVGMGIEFGRSKRPYQPR